MGKIRAIVKRPDEEYGHMTQISNTLKNLQKIVDGNIETVTIGNVVIICDVDGRNKNKERNCTILPKLSLFPTTLYGTIIVVGQNGDDFADIDLSFDAWKQIYLGVE